MNILAPPAIGQQIVHDGKEYATVKEGLAYILVPAEGPEVPQQTPKGNPQSQDVFYNPIQQFNRDLSVLAIKAYGEQAVEQDRKRAEKSRNNALAKKIKKRKRDEDSYPLTSEAPRKAGKLDAHIAGSKEPVVHKVRQDSDIKNQLEEDVFVQAGHFEETENINGSAPENVVDEMRTTSVKTEATFAKGLATGPDLQPKPLPESRFSILDALSATGLRALRYAHEIPFATSITANDILPSATKQIMANVEHNKLTSKIKTLTGNALTHMYSFAGANTRPTNGAHPKTPRKYDVIDLDPYGTAAPFLDAAVQAVRDDGGLLCITCTDAGVWASNGYPEKCYALYGGTPIKGPLSHEAGLRLILHAIASSAARYGLAMTPLLSLSIDFYARVFVRIHKSPLEVKFLAGKTMCVYSCDTGCGAWKIQILARNRYTTNKNGNKVWKHSFSQGPTTQEYCSECGFRTHIGGPMYAGPLHSPEFIQTILDGMKHADNQIYQTLPRIQGMLTLALEECLSLLPESEDGSLCNSHASPLPPEADSSGYGPATLDPAPFFFMLPNLSKVVHTVTPHENAIRGALMRLGYRVTRSHTKGGSIKTDAPWNIIWKVMREWVKQKSPIKEGAIREGTAGWRILGCMNLKKAESEQTRDIEAGEGRRGDNIASRSETEVEVVFDEKLGTEKDRKKLVRYQRNPRENWGPMARAKGKTN